MPTVQTSPKLGSVSFDVSSSTNIQNSFQTAKSASVALPQLFDSSVKIVPEYLVVNVSSIGLATKLTIAISTDSGGDALVIPDTEATIALGKTTTTDGLAGYAIQLPFIASSATTLYLHFKADAGNTMDIDSASLFFGRGAT